MKKLTKSLRQRKIAGVCGGIAEYLNVDVTVVRLVTIALMMAAGSGLLAYIVAAVVMPDPEEEKYED
jgi:phage shock protein C